MPYATYRFNKIIAAETIRFIVTVAIVVYKGLKLVVYRMLTQDSDGVVKMPSMEKWKDKATATALYSRPLKKYIPARHSSNRVSR